MKACLTLLAVLVLTLPVMGCGTRSQEAAPVDGTEAEIDLLEVSRELQSQLDADPDNVQVQEALGNVFARRGLYAEAISLYRDVVQTEAGTAATWHNLALCYERQSLIRDALSAAHTAAEMEPDNRFFVQEIGRLEALQRDVLSGERAFTSKLTEGHRLLQRVREDVDMLPELADLTDELLEHWPEQSDAWNLAGMVALQQHDPARAATCFETAIARDPGSLQARYNRAMLAWDAGDRAVAEAQFTAILNVLPPDDDRARSYVQQLREDLAAGKTPTDARVLARTPDL